MSQTATQQLYDYFFKLFEKYNKDEIDMYDFGSMFTDEFIRLKIVEKGQIMDAYNEGNAEWTAIIYRDANHYYTETYNQ